MAASIGRSPLFVILFTVFVDLIGFGVVLPLMPYYNESVGGGPAVLGLLIASFFFMQFLFAPVFGWLSDRVGRRPVILGTLILATAGHLLLSVAGTLALLFAARVVAGVASGNLSVAQAFIADRTPPQERARAMGLIGAAFGVGFAVGPVIGGTLVAFGLWAPALAAAALAGANLVLTSLFLPESFTPMHRTAREARDRPRLTQALRRTAIPALLATFFVVSFSFSTVPVAFPLFGIQSFGLKPFQLALVFVFIGVINLLFGMSAGRLARRFGEERFVAGGTFAIMAGLAATPLVRDLGAYILVVGVVAAGVAVAFPLLPSLVSKRTRPQEQGAVLGITQSIGSAARVPGPFVAGLLYEQINPAAPFELGAGLMAVGFAMTLLVYRESRRIAARATPAAMPSDK